MAVLENNYVIENLNNLPIDFLTKLKDLLNDNVQFVKILALIDTSGVTLERNNYQITFNCREEIESAKELLNIQLNK